MDPGIAFFFFNEDSEPSSDSEDEAAVVNAIVLSCSAVAEVAINAEQKKRKIIRRGWRVEEIEKYSDTEFQQDFRMTRQAYNWLLSKIQHNLQNFSVGRSTVPPKISVAKQFGMSRSTLYKCVRRVVKEITSLAPDVIRWPSVEERIAIKRQMVHWANIPGVVGAIDGTFIPIKAPTQNPECYNNRKCFHSITLQAICDNRRRFTDVFVGYPSSVGDARIFRNSDFFEAVTTNAHGFFNEREIILGDKAYPLLKWCIPPYIDRGNLGRQEVNFNKMHAKTCQVIERAFALLFGRFRRLKYVDMTRTDLIPEFVLACCVLHNLCLEFPDPLLDIYEVEGQNCVVGNDADRAEDAARENMEMLRVEGQHLRDQIATDLLVNN